MSRVYRVVLFLIIIFFSGWVKGQPPPGSGPGGTPNDPCARPNPPPGCSNVPIDEDVHYLVLGGILLGLYFVVKKKKMISKGSA